MAKTTNKGTGFVLNEKRGVPVNKGKPAPTKTKASSSKGKK